MKNLKKNGKRFFALFLSLVMALGIMQTSAIAASWNPGDKITINVRVFDASTGKTYDVGTDSVEKGDQYIQSVNYQIPQLTKFVKADQFGRVTKVAGNWYFPSGDSQPGANVEWSCNVSKVTMTYWVNWFSTGSGTGGDTSGTIDLGGSGRNTINFTIRYHSNYPSGANYTATKKYSVKSYATIYNVFSSQFLTYTDCGFGGFTPKSTEKTWYTTTACTTVAGTIGATNNGTYDLYAGWEPGPTPVETLTLTYMNDSALYNRLTGLSAGDEVSLMSCDAKKDGYTFKGWDTAAAAATVMYEAGDILTIEANTTLYAVWEKNSSAPEATECLTLKKVFNGLDEIPDFSIEWQTTYGDTQYTTSKTLTYDNAYSIDEDNLTLMWKVPHYYVGAGGQTSNVVITENCNVEGYTYTTTASPKRAVVDNDTHTVTVTYGSSVSSGTVTLTNSYETAVTPPVPVAVPTIKMQLERKDASGQWYVANSGDGSVAETLNPEEEVRYTITVTNSYDVSAGRQVIVNDLPLVLEMESATCHGYFDGREIDPITYEPVPEEELGLQQIWVIDDFTAGSVLTITYEAIVNSTVAGAVTNAVGIDNSLTRSRIYGRVDVGNISQFIPSAPTEIIITVPSDDAGDGQAMEATASDEDSGLVA